MSVHPSPDLFSETPPPANPLVGIAVRLPRACSHCGADIAEIGDGKGPHAAALHCTQCGAFRGWLSRESYAFVAEITKNFGRPTAPITVRIGRSNEKTSDMPPALGVSGECE